MDKAKRARKAETPKQPSLRLRLRAPYLYPDRVDSAAARSAVAPDHAHIDWPPILSNPIRWRPPRRPRREARPRRKGHLVSEEKGRKGRKEERKKGRKEERKKGRKEERKKGRKE